MTCFVKNIYHVYVVGKPCPLITIASTYALLSSNLYAYLQLYIQSFRFSSLHLSFGFFFFFSEQDGYEVKVAFVSNRFEDIVFLDAALNSKHKIRLLNLSQMTKQFFNIGVTIFTHPTSSMEEDFSHK